METAKGRILVKVHDFGRRQEPCSDEAHCKVDGAKRNVLRSCIFYRFKACQLCITLSVSSKLKQTLGFWSPENCKRLISSIKMMF